MVVVWIALLTPLLGRSPVSQPAATALFGLMCTPWLLAPLLALGGIWTSSYRTGFTHLMQWSIFPVVSIFLALCVAAVARARREGRIAAACFREPAPAAVGTPPAFRRTFDFTGWQRTGRRSPRGYARQRDVSKRRGESWPRIRFAATPVPAATPAYVWASR